MGGNDTWLIIHQLGIIQSKQYILHQVFHCFVIGKSNICFSLAVLAGISMSLVPVFPSHHSRKEKLDVFPEYLNSYHTIKFTWDIISLEMWLYLDVMVSLEDGRFLTEVYHKPTDTRQCLNKINLVILRMLKRAYQKARRCDWEGFVSRIRYLRID